MADRLNTAGIRPRLPLGDLQTPGAESHTSGQTGLQIGGPVDWPRVTR